MIMKRIFTISLLLSLFSYSMAQENLVIDKFMKSYDEEKQKKYDDAIQTMKSIKENTYEKNLRIGELYYHAEDFAKAKMYFQDAVQLKPLSIEARLLVVQAAARVSDWQTVIDSYDEILEIDPDNKTALYYRGLTYYNTKQYTLAKLKLERYNVLYPTNYDGVILLAWTYYHMDLRSRAKQFFDLAICINSESKSAREGYKALGIKK